MTDENITSNYLQGRFWANLGLNMFNATVLKKISTQQKKRQKDYWSSTLMSFSSQEMKRKESNANAKQKTKC